MNSRTIGNDVIQNYKFCDWEIAGGRMDTFTTSPLFDPPLNMTFDYDMVENKTSQTYNRDKFTKILGKTET